MNYIEISEAVREYLRLKGVAQGLIDLMAVLHCAALDQQTLDLIKVPIKEEGKEE